MKNLNLVATLLVSSALMNGCHRPEETGWNAEQPTRYCVDRQNRRVPDDQCERSNGSGSGGVNPFLYYYLGTLNGHSGYVPPYGGLASGGGYQPYSGVNYSTSRNSFAAASAASAARASSNSGYAGAGRSLAGRGGFGSTASSFGSAGGDGGAGE